MISMIRIFGCGVSGLVCCIELIKNGIDHEVIGHPAFYRKGCECQGIPLDMDHVFSPLKAREGRFGLQPVLTTSRFIVSFGKTKKEFHTEIDLYIRGNHKDSVDNQLLEMYKELGGRITKKRFGLNDIEGETIVAADGYRSVICERFEVNKANRIGGAIICIAKGNFDTDISFIMFDKKISGHGYSYILPHSKKEATVAVCLPDPTNLPERLEMFKKTAKEQFDIKSFSSPHSGFEKLVKNPVPYIKKGNQEIYFIGDAASTNEPLAGFGILNAIASGQFCAFSIIKNNPDMYKEKFKEIQNKNKRNMMIRRIFEKAGINYVTEKFLFRTLNKNSAGL